MQRGMCSSFSDFCYFLTRGNSQNQINKLDSAINWVDFWVITTTPVYIIEKKGTTQYLFSGDKLETIDISKTNASNDYLLKSLDFKLILMEAPKGTNKILGADENNDLVIMDSSSGLIQKKIVWGDFLVTRDNCEQIGETDYFCLIKMWAPQIAVLDFGKNSIILKNSIISYTYQMVQIPFKSIFLLVSFS